MGCSGSDGEEGENPKKNYPIKTFLLTSTYVISTILNSSTHMIREAKALKETANPTYSREQKQSWQEYANMERSNNLSLNFLVPFEAFIWPTPKPSKLENNVLNNQ